MVKIEVGREDSVWIALLIVLVGVGFVYATVGVDPSIMGHDLSSGVAQIGSALYCDENGANCFSAADVAGAGAAADLVYGLRSSAQCTAAGGTVVTVEGSNKVCKFSAASCAAGGWVPYKSWSTTTNRVCSFTDERCFSLGAPTAKTCNTGSHVWGNTGLESCSASVYDCSTSGTYSEPECDCNIINPSCSNTKTEIGCY